MAEEDHNYYQQMAKKPKMSSIDEKSTAEECYPRDSLDRYGDDLCEEILSYLSLEDCFRFECLSKQWQRSVYKRQHVFDVDIVLMEKKVHHRGRHVGQTIAKDVNWRALEAVVKKCPNITAIDMIVNSKDTETLFERLMNAYNDSLTAIHIRFMNCDNYMAKTIVDKYGHRLTAITTPGYQSRVDALKPHLKSCTQLTQLSAIPNDVLYLKLSALFGADNELLVKGLTHFELSIKYENILPLLTPFVDHYRHSLKSIRVSFERDVNSQLIGVLNELSRLNHLRHLSVFIKTRIHKQNHKSLIGCLQRLATECKLLKRLELKILAINGTQVRRLYHSLYRFQRLRGLQLFVEKPKSDESDDTLKDLTLNSLSPLKRLTHLSLNFEDFMISETFFDSIDTLLPRIESLRGSSGLEITPRIEESVKQLPKLRHFYFSKTDHLQPFVIDVDESSGDDFSDSGSDADLPSWMIQLD